MPRVHVFADESGDFTFARTANASRYYILTTVTSQDFGLGSAMLDLRRKLAWEGIGLDREFHATTDRQEVRDRVFAVLAAHTFRIDCTLLEKAKAMPHLRSTRERFYKYAWYFHMKHITPKVVRSGDELLVVGASIGTNKQRSLIHSEVKDVVAQVAPTVDFRVACWAAASEPCLQVADYCSWAIQRKWERADTRSYALIQGRIATEFDIFRSGSTMYY
jgi:hypothetical protein